MKKQSLFFFLVLIPALSLAQAKKTVISVEQNSDPRLIGTWATDCLTPRLEDPWSERHTFVFYKNFMARHERIAFDAPGCAGSVINHFVDNYKYVIEGKVSTGEGGGLIILKGDKGAMQDNYFVAGNILTFGHGFRNTQSYGTPLNTYLIYKKLSK